MTTSKEELEIFLEDLSVFFPIALSRNKHEVFERYAEYLYQICENKNYKFTPIKNWIINNYTKSGFPEITYIRNALKKGEIANIQTTADDGKLVVVTLTNGRIYSFVITANATMTLNDIKEKTKLLIREEKDPGRKHYKYADIKIYPKGSVLIGNKIYQ